MDVEIRAIAEDEFEEFLRAVALSFSGVVTPEDLTRERLVAEIDRCLVAVDDGRMVGRHRLAAPAFHRRLQQG